MPIASSSSAHVVYRQRYYLLLILILLLLLLLPDDMLTYIKTIRTCTQNVKPAECPTWLSDFYLTTVRVMDFETVLTPPRDACNTWVYYVYIIYYITLLIGRITRFIGNLTRSSTAVRQL